MIGVFLALLELIREKKILVQQADDDLGDMEIDAAPEEHRRTYEHASLNLSDAERDDAGERGGRTTETLSQTARRMAGEGRGW